MGVVERIGTEQPRFPEHGRIKLGRKVPAKQKGKTRPDKLSHFRFTSTDEAVLHQLAGLYGGEVTPWHDDRAVPKDQFELLSEADKIVVMVPGLDHVSQWYELWSDAGCIRRCDGETVEVPEKTEDGWEVRTQGCLCEEEGKLVCRKTTRLSFILPNVAFGGVWRLESKGKTAGAELPTMDELIRGIQQGRGMLAATLEIAEAQSFGGARQFVVPRLRLLDSPLAIASGQAGLASLMPSHGETLAELGAGHTDGLAGARAALNGAPAHPDDDVADAEIVEDWDETTFLVKAGALTDTAWAKHEMLTAEDIIRGVLLSLSGGQLQAVGQLNERQRAKLHQALEDLYDGVAVVVAVTDSGALIMERKQ